MKISSKLDRLHAWARSNRWIKFFSIFVRIVLAAGFLPSGFVKVAGERFTSLANNHPMGHYLEALYHTGFYYPFIGVMQMTAAVLLLIPRTATLGAMIYLPIILNICILSYAVRFDGSAITSPLMVLAVLFLLCYDYHKLKYIFPFNHKKAKEMLPEKSQLNSRFPVAFFGLVLAAFVTVFLVYTQGFDLLPRNYLKECQTQCSDKEDPKACLQFCSCIHEEGNSLNQCLDAYEAYTAEAP